MTRKQWNNLFDAMEPLSEAQRIQIHNTVALDIRILLDMNGHSAKMIPIACRVSHGYLHDR